MKGLLRNWPESAAAGRPGRWPTPTLPRDLAPYGYFNVGSQPGAVRFFTPGRPNSNPGTACIINRSRAESQQCSVFCVQYSEPDISAKIFECLCEEKVEWYPQPRSVWSRLPRGGLRVLSGA